MVTSVVGDCVRFVFWSVFRSMVGSCVLALWCWMSSRKKEKVVSGVTPIATTESESIFLSSIQIQMGVLFFYRQRGGWRQNVRWFDAYQNYII
jgi:hypothetical protein